MKYKLPIACPKGTKPTITQPYGDKSNVAWYQANGLNLTEHNGVDFVIETIGKPYDATLTYGTRLVCPVPHAWLSKSWWENPMSTNGNGVQFSWDEGGDGYSVRLWHCSEIVTKSSYNETDTLGYIGNSGLVRPDPLYTQPFNGAHLHLMVFKNGVLVDPLTIFDTSQWYEMPDTSSEKDNPPLFWVLSYIKKQVEKLKVLISK